MSLTVDTMIASQCREVTPGEAAHFNEKGWVQLKRFIDPDGGDAARQGKRPDGRIT